LTLERTDSVFILGAAVVLPSLRLPVSEVVRAERARYRAQLDALSPHFRERITAGLGIEWVRQHDAAASTLAVEAGRQALERARVAPEDVRLVIDYSTLAGDYPGLWSLANKVQADLGCADAATLTASGSGCAGLHLGLRVALAMMQSDPSLDVALLVASDCVGEKGRSCLPISILGDGASALVLGRGARAPETAPQILGLACSTLGVHQEVIRLEGTPPQLQIDGHRFESKVLPLHFVMSQRVLSRALVRAHKCVEDIDALVYPNTTILDRESVVRALGIAPERLSGPGPTELGHVFASDMVINLPPGLVSAAPDRAHCTALLAVGSGFTWGACIVGT
jgi:3-oxoacyl-[acyl-carrier-protein] synthase-3